MHECGQNNLSFTEIIKEFISLLGLMEIIIRRKSQLYIIVGYIQTSWIDELRFSNINILKYKHACKVKITGL